jgi:hypothetical protein
MVAGDGGLGESLVGEKIQINHRHVSVAKMLGEGTFRKVLQAVSSINDSLAPQRLFFLTLH